MRPDDPTLNKAVSDQPPVFIVGAHRSGTTLLRLMLDHHPEISVPGEFDFLTEIMADRNTQPTGPEYFQYLSLHRGFLAQGFECNPQDAYEKLVRSFVQQLLIRHPAKVFIAVVHTGFEELARIWPDAKFIHIIRDPRDVAASAIKLGWAGNVYTGVPRWVAAEAAWNRLCKTVPLENRCEIHFETLICDLSTTLRKLCLFLKLAYSEEMLDYHRYTTYEPPNSTLVNQWKRKLSSTEIGLVEGVLGDLLREKGYQPSGHPVIHPSSLMRMRLKLQDRFARLRFSIKRFGVWNTFGAALARRLKLSALERRFRLRINTIAVKHLK